MCKGNNVPFSATKGCLNDRYCSPQRVGCGFDLCFACGDRELRGKRLRLAGTRGHNQSGDTQMDHIILEMSLQKITSEKDYGSRNPMLKVRDAHRVNPRGESVHFPALPQEKQLSILLQTRDPDGVVTSDVEGAGVFMLRRGSVCILPGNLF